MKKPAEVLKLAKDNNVRIVDLRFMDMPGIWQHFSVPLHQVSESSFEDGFGFDGSSIRGFQAIHESDLLVVPDADTAFLDPFTEVPTLVLICNIHEPITKQRYVRDPRAIAQRAENYLQFTRIADTAYFGPRPSSSSSTTCASSRRRTAATTTSTRSRAVELGTRGRTEPGVQARHKEGISRCRRPITSRTCALRWFSTWNAAG